MNIVFLSFPFFMSDIAEAFNRLGHKVKILRKENTPGRGASYNFDDDVTTAIKKSFPGFQPDILFFLSNVSFPKNIEKIPFTTVGYFVDSHIHFDIWHKDYMPVFDFVFIDQKYYLKKAKKLGIKRCFFLPQCCHYVDLKNYQVKKDFDIGFVGHVKGRFKRGYYLKSFSKHFKTNFQTGVYGEEKAKVLQSAKILFHESLNEAIGTRVFESLATGGMLLTDKVYGIEELFEDKKHLVYYENLNNAINKAEYYLAHPQEREKIAKTGQKLVRQKHTPLNRAKEIIKILKENDLKEAYRKRLKGAKLYYYLGRAYYGIGYKERAIEYLQRYLETESPLVFGQKAKAKLLLLLRSYGGDFFNRLIRFIIRLSSIYVDKFLRRLEK